MKENIPEATVVMAKCSRSRQSFGIRMERKANRTWYCTWTFRLSDTAASREGYSDTSVSGLVDLDQEYPGCPYCEAMGWFKCGNCGKLTCNSGETYVTCAWCGQSGEAQAADHFDLSGGGY